VEFNAGNMGLILCQGSGKRLFKVGFDYGERNIGRGRRRESPLVEHIFVKIQPLSSVCLGFFCMKISKRRTAVICHFFLAFLLLWRYNFLTLGGGVMRALRTAGLAAGGACMHVPFQDFASGGNICSAAG
jgi:hypothetical protein